MIHQNVEQVDMLIVFTIKMYKIFSHDHIQKISR